MKRFFIPVATGVFLVSTTAVAYRTAQDEPEFAGSKSPIRWQNDRIDFDVNGPVPQGVDQESFSDLVEASFNGWSEVTCQQPKFAVRSGNEQPVAGDGKNTVIWVYEGWGEIGRSPQELGITEVQYAYDGEDWSIVEADVYLNAENHDWSSGLNLSQTLMHEAGHVLGLLHPCDENIPCEAVDAALMLPTYANQSLVVSPSSDDAAGICYLYPQDHCFSSLDCTEGSTCLDHVCSDLCGTLICSPGERCNVDKCEVPEECSEGFCPSDSVLVAGNSCDSSQECGEMFCRTEGYCSTYCTFAEECPPNWLCIDGACSVGELGLLGDSCVDAGSCAQGLCLRDRDQDYSVCTRVCGSPDVECSDGWTCELVEEQQVCVPPLTTISSCAYSSSPHRVGHENWIWLAIAGAMVVMRKQGGEQRR